MGTAFFATSIVRRLSSVSEQQAQSRNDTEVETAPLPIDQSPEKAEIGSEETFNPIDTEAFFCSCFQIVLDAGKYFTAVGLSVEPHRK